jgi:hypothetical protein
MACRPETLYGETLTPIARALTRALTEQTLHWAAPGLSRLGGLRFVW